MLGAMVLVDMKYDDMYAWTRTFDLLANRVSIINQILGANVVWVSYKRGLYVCTVCGAKLCDFRIYDLPSIDAAFASVDALSDGLWLLNRSGRLCFK